jgi:hypothetical protein
MDERYRSTIEDDEAPLVPELPRRDRARTDGGRPVEGTGRRLADRPVDTGYADGSTRDREELLPLVPDLTGRQAD